MGHISEYKTMVIVTCEICGKKWNVPKYRKGTHLCSQQCIGKYLKEKNSVELKCEHCEEIFKVRKSLGNIRKFCSKECMYLARDVSGKNNPNWAGGKMKCVCEWCGVSFEKRSNKKSNMHFCSLVCHGKWTSKYKAGKNNQNYRGRIITKQCDNCEKFVTRQASRFERAKYSFCSTKCDNQHRRIRYSNEGNPQWIGGRSKLPYPREWKTNVREDIRNRDKHSCQLCGHEWNNKESKLHIHHIDYNKENCSSLNLISLCLKCHSQAHHNRLFWESTFKYFINQMEVA